MEGSTGISHGGSLGEETPGRRSGSRGSFRSARVGVEVVGNEKIALLRCSVRVD